MTIKTIKVQNIGTVYKNATLQNPRDKIVSFPFVVCFWHMEFYHVSYVAALYDNLLCRVILELKLLTFVLVNVGEGLDKSHKLPESFGTFAALQIFRRDKFDAFVDITWVWKVVSDKLNTVMTRRKV